MLLESLGVKIKSLDVKNECVVKVLVPLLTRYTLSLTSLRDFFLKNRLFLSDKRCIYMNN